MGYEHRRRPGSLLGPSDDGIPSPAVMAAAFNEVRTARLVLRRLRAEDGPAMFAVHGDPETNRYNPVGPDRDLATSEGTLRSWTHHWDEYGFGYWAAALQGLEDVIGFGGITRAVFRGRRVLNLYYRFSPSAWGHGYAAELARAAVALGREFLPQWPVVARMRPANIPSMRTAERAGLQRRPDLDTEHLVYTAGWP